MENLDVDDDDLLDFEEEFLQKIQLSSRFTSVVWKYFDLYQDRRNCKKYAQCKSCFKYFKVCSFIFFFLFFLIFIFFLQYHQSTTNLMRHHCKNRLNATLSNFNISHAHELLVIEFMVMGLVCDWSDFGDSRQNCILAMVFFLFRAEKYFFNFYK